MPGLQPHEIVLPVQVSATAPHCCPAGRSAHDFGAQHALLEPQSWPPPHPQLTELPHALVCVPGLQPLHVGVGHEHVVPLHTLPLPHAQVFGEPQPLSMVPHVLATHVLAVMQVPPLQHCEPEHDEQVMGALDASGSTVASPALHVVWCASPLQSVPQAAGDAQQCAPLTGVPLPSRGTTFVAPEHPQVYCTPHASVLTS